MDMYQKRKIRAEKKKDDSPKSFPSVGINWFPGHMAKTRRQITEDLKMIDVVVEILDARIPNSSQNPDIRQITQNKKKVIVLNKYDLSDKVKVEKWVEYFTKKGQKVVLADSLTGRGINETTRQKFCFDNGYRLLRDYQINAIKAPDNVPNVPPAAA